MIPGDTMMLALLAPTAFALCQSGSTSPAEDARATPSSRKPLLASDALIVLPGELGRIVSVGDLDGGGRPDLVVARGRERRPERVDVIALESGETLTTLWASGAPPFGVVTWDAGGDANGDGVPDVVLGFPEAGVDLEGTGEVQVVSGADGALLHRTVGEHQYALYGASVAFLGDLDGDGRDDYAVGATELDPCARLFPEGSSIGTTISNEGTVNWIQLTDGRRVEERSFLQERMRLRSTFPGSVSVRSGSDGSELWRASGDVPGHGFGRHVASAGYLDDDGRRDLLVQSDLYSDEPIVLFSGATGAELARIEHRLSWCGCAGDLDADGIPDLFLDGGDRYGKRIDRVELRSGRTLEPLFQARYPDEWSDYGVTVALGDVDGDGHDDFGLGEANFGLRGPEEGGRTTLEHLRAMTLAKACALPSMPRCLIWESGCAVVVSGRTHEIIWGVWGRPGSFDGMGLQMTSIPDVTGDGLADLVVVAAEALYVLPGPGSSPRDD